MAGRPPTYHVDEERPVSVSLRMPKALYEQAQQRVQQRRMTLTEALLEGLQLWLETPTDPRALFVSDNSKTVILQLQVMVTTTVQAELAKLLNMALPLPTPDRPPTNHDIRYDGGNTLLQTESPQQGFDTTRYRLGTRCPQGHDYQGTGHSLRRQHQWDCVACGKLAKRAKRARHVPLG
jgi:hypothetical protein